jgi:cupin superfamily acireductone dioxygenase involved in methionine salvage
MAHIVNPNNLDVEDDDALFAGALFQGLIWIEDDEDDSAYEFDDLDYIVEDFETSTPTAPKNKRSHARNTKRKSLLATQAVRDYYPEDVLQAARDFVRAQDTAWVKFSRVSQHLHERFDRLNLKRLTQGKEIYKSAQVHCCASE